MLRVSPAFDPRRIRVASGWLRGTSLADCERPTVKRGMTAATAAARLGRGMVTIEMPRAGVMPRIARPGS